MEKQNEKQKMKKPEPDLMLERTNRDPHGQLFYHPSILSMAITGAIIGGILLGFIAWMVADGAWSVVGLGQMSAGNRGPGAFFGFVVGSGIGGLFGGLLGIHSILRENRRVSEEKSRK
ncbi:hypothetical protein [Salinimicrobium sp. GXAS 041]|uniref:hypothetical protein n=1 Tax=Salinimicrobium sp. GXAS 041 TaxID=3400806 RepID=UPI003C75B49E